MTTPIVPSKVRTVFEGRVFTVQVESITLPKGHALDAEIVRHPGSVVIVPMTPANEVILVRQYRHAIGRYTWELPAGSLKPAEDPLVAARRECQEEIGMVAERHRSKAPPGNTCTGPAPSDSYPTKPSGPVHGRDDSPSRPTPVPAPPAARYRPGPEPPRHRSVPPR